MMRIPKSLHRFLYKIAYVLLRIYWFVFQPHTRSVLGILLHGAGAETEILLIRHTYDRKGWLLPGGSVNRNERPEDALRRELQEELTLDAVDVTLAISTDTFINYHYSHVDYFVARLKSKDFSIDTVEIAEASWFKLSKLPEVMEGKDIILKCIRV